MLCLSLQGYPQNYFLNSKTWRHEGWEWQRPSCLRPQHGSRRCSGRRDLHFSLCSPGREINPEKLLGFSAVTQKKKKDRHHQLLLFSYRETITLDALCTKLDPVSTRQVCSEKGCILVSRSPLDVGGCKTHSKQLYLANTRSATDIHRSRILQYLESLR